MENGVSSSPSDVLILPAKEPANSLQDCYVCVRPPAWYVEADALFLRRTGSREIKLIEDQNQSSPASPRGQRRALLTTDSLDFDDQCGPRVVLGYTPDKCHRAEIVYYGAHFWRSDASLDSTAVPLAPPNLSMPFDADYTSDFDGASHVDVSYTSELHNAEGNYYFDRGWWLTPLIGFRYVNLDEQFDYQSTDIHGNIPETGLYRIHTDNNLIGGQIGAALNRPLSERFSWNFDIKAGLFVDFAHQHTWLYDHDQQHQVVKLRDFERNQGEVAFVGEIRLGVTYQVRECVAVSAGYQVTWLEGVALAPEQLDYNTGPSAGSRLNDNGGVFYDGGYLGLVITL